MYCMKKNIAGFHMIPQAKSFVATLWDGSRGWLRLLAGLFALVLTACNRTSPASDTDAAPLSAPDKGVVEVKVRKTTGGFQLLRNGKPYYLRGGAGLQQLAQLREAGGNTLRLWSTAYAAPLLDEAQRQGLTVMLGLWLEPESKLFSYYDPAAVAAQQRRLRKQILLFRNHPALLLWNVGNELELSSPGPRLFEAINDVARMIHELDPHHPVTTSMSTFELYSSELQRSAPAVDILSINIYGRLKRLPSLLKKSGWRGPYIVSEYGGRGFWESDSTSWRAPIEQTSAGKAEFTRSRYQVMRSDSAHCLGSYVFFWGNKFEYTPTWFSLFEPTGEKTETVDDLHLLWRKRYPANRAPHLTEVLLAGRSFLGNVFLRPGRQYPAAVTVTDPEGDSLAIRWEMLPEMRFGAGIKEIATPLEPVPGAVVRAWGRQAVICTPTQPGAYRLYVRAFDGHGSVGTANIPLLVRVAPVARAYSAATISD